MENHERALQALKEYMMFPLLLSINVIFGINIYIYMYIYTCIYIYIYIYIYIPLCKSIVKATTLSFGQIALRKKPRGLEPSALSQCSSALR